MDTHTHLLILLSHTGSNSLSLTHRHPHMHPHTESTGTTWNRTWYPGCLHGVINTLSDKLERSKNTFLLEAHFSSVNLWMLQGFFAYYIKTGEKKSCQFHAKIFSYKDELHSVNLIKLSAYVPLHMCASLYLRTYIPTLHLRSFHPSQLIHELHLRVTYILKPCSLATLWQAHYGRGAHWGTAQ